MMVDLFRRDQADTVTGPNLDDTSSYAEHIVHARGKRTRFTSVSTSRDAIRDFGPQLWMLLQPKVTVDGHSVVAHDDLVSALRQALSEDGDAPSREFAARAIPRAIRRREALVQWSFKIDGVERKDRMSWAERHVRTFFIRG